MVVSPADGAHTRRTMKSLAAPRLAILVGAILAGVLVSPSVRASCRYQPPKPFNGRVKTCKVVDPHDVQFKNARENYRGLFLELDDARGQEVKGWIPEHEGASCSALPAGATLKATMSFACCDGDPNPPCYIGTANILTDLVGVKTSPPAASTPPPLPTSTPPADNTSFAQQPPVPIAPPASPPSEPAPGPRNCGCRTVGGVDGTPTIASALAIAAVTVLVAGRRRRRAP